MERVLVVMPNWVGDVLLATPLLRAVRQGYPDARLGVVVAPRCRSLLDGGGIVDSIIPLDERGAQRGLWARWQWVRSLRRGAWQRVFLLRPSRTRTALMSLAGITDRVGHAHPKVSRWLTTAVPSVPGLRHRAEQYLDLARAHDLPLDDQGLQLPLTQTDRSAARRLLQSLGVEGPYAVVHPAGNWDLKRWPAARFAEVADKLVERYGWTVLLSGSPADTHLVTDIAEHMQQTPVITSGHTSLRSLAAILARATLLICNDSGPLHMATAVGTQTVGVFGPTHPDHTGPYRAEAEIVRVDVGCNWSSCLYTTCPQNRCLTAVQPALVMEAIDRLVPAGDASGAVN